MFNKYYYWWFTDQIWFMLSVHTSNRSRFTHSVVDSSPIGGLDQYFVACCSDFLHMLRGKRCPSLPHINVLPSDSHHTFMMTRPPLATHTAFHPPALVSNKSQHSSPRLHRKSSDYTSADRLARAYLQPYMKNFLNHFTY